MARFAATETGLALAHCGKQVLRFNGALSMFCLWEGSVVQKSTAELSVQWTTARQHGQEFGLFQSEEHYGYSCTSATALRLAWLKTWWMFACSHCTCCSPMQPYYWTWFFCNFPQCCIISIFVISTMISFSSFFSTLFLHIPIMVVGFSQFLVRISMIFPDFFFPFSDHFPNFSQPFSVPLLALKGRRFTSGGGWSPLSLARRPAAQRNA